MVLEVVKGRFICDGPDVCKRPQCSFYDDTAEGTKLYLDTLTAQAASLRSKRSRKIRFACRYVYGKRERRIHRNILKDPSEIVAQLKAEKKGEEKIR